jgi:hypothetical protein
LESAPIWQEPQVVTAEERGLRFDSASEFTVGVEDELMLVDPTTFALVPAIDVALARVSGDARFTRELRTAQLEIVTPQALPGLLADGLFGRMTGGNELARLSDSAS